MPKAKGRYPAVLKLPGAGIRSYAGDVEHAANGWIVFEIGIHGIPVNMSGPVYTNLYMGALKGYHTFNLDNRDKYYYKRVYLAVYVPLTLFIPYTIRWEQFDNIRQ